MNFSDEKLFQLCRQYGRNALLWRQKFIGLLPEVNKRRLYEKKGFESIFVFAKKLAGLSEEQVRNALNLSKQFEDKPAVKSLLENGEVSINKLIRVSSVVTQENQEFWATQVQLLPKSALETLVKDERKSEPQNSFQEPLLTDVELPGQLPNPGKILELNLNPQNIDELLELQQKGIDINQLISEMLAERKIKIAEEKEEISKAIQPAKSRYISVQIKKFLQKEYGNKCSIQGCQKAAIEIHHTQRYKLVRTHDPKFLARLCKEHHQIAHTIDVQYHEIKAKALSLPNPDPH